MTDLIKREDALLPCPFCGGEASKIPDPNHSTGWEVGCFSGKCDVEPHVWAVHLETAAMQWNTRADRIEELNERLTAATDDAKEAEAYAEELEARNKELTLQLLATSGQAADAVDKLTKAMAGLRKIADHKHFSLDQGWMQNTEARIASAVLAELEKTE